MPQIEMPIDYMPEFPGKTCRDCNHVVCLETESGKRFFYCRVTYCGRTYHHMKKIKLKNEACHRFNDEKIK